ncbi:MAG TPA: lanthionine synthetase LanC family protein [Thermoanaerobaculia bacterium]|nr:lanthionine synthetase LanC family protein [Thermoanaerobaculia bacterium]
MSLPWRPLLAGKAAAQALSAAREIAAVTSRGVTHAPDRPVPEGIAVWENALASGRAGQCLLHAYLALHSAGDAHAGTATALLDQAIDAAAVLPMTASLYLGFPGIAWAAAHLARRLFVEDEDGCREVDRILLRSLRRASWEGSYNLIIGLVGLGIYALERLPRPSAVRCLEAVIAQLAGRAVHTPEGATFFTPAAGLLPQHAAAYPQGAYVLGMAEGVAGVIALLGSACDAGVSVRVARPLLGDTVSWLLARERPHGNAYRFPAFHFPGVEPTGGRAASWARDLGIAASLLMAARGAGEPGWETEARRVALAVAARLKSHLRDPGLALGAAGAAHVFNRLYQATGERELGKAARRWLRLVLALREPGLGIGGFRVVPRSDADGWWDDPGFLNGATGIGLALLAAASHVDPAWDRALLLSPLAGGTTSS